MSQTSRQSRAWESDSFEAKELKVGCHQDSFPQTHECPCVSPPTAPCSPNPRLSLTSALGPSLTGLCSEQEAS